MKIDTILDQIDLGSIALPEFQRGYVWNREQVRKLMRSLYRGHPVGTLLVWLTKTETSDTRGDGPITPGSVKLLLDGQQRITSLYGIVRGKPPLFFDGDPSAFAGLHFNLEDQSFEFYAQQKMKDNLLWVNVTELMKAGVAPFIQQLATNPTLQPKLTLQRDFVQNTPILPSLLKSALDRTVEQRPGCISRNKSQTACKLDTLSSRRKRGGNRGKSPVREVTL